MTDTLRRRNVAALKMLVVVMNLRQDRSASLVQWAIDRIERRKLSSGEQNPMAKLTTEQVREIRQRKDIPIRKIAAEYGVAHGTVSHIRTRRSWKHV